MPCASPSRESRQARDVEVDIGGKRLKFEKIIGRGAFGVVHLARDPSGGEAAVKVINAKDGQAFATAAFEAELLQILTRTMNNSQKQACKHVPQYIAHSSTRSSNGSGGGTVKLAMSFCPGGALDKWLYGISDEEHKSVDIAQLIDGRLPGGQQANWNLRNSHSIVRDLIKQLSGVFAALEQIAFHRDVSSHNVLVDFPEGQNAVRPQFALIDFGLAVRSGSWNREWRSSNLAGDPRYWTPSAWMAFAFGFKYVATHPNSGLQAQYLGRMDHFSLGVLALETFFALWHTREAQEGDAPGLLEVRAAWCKYWVAVINLFQMFHGRGAQEVRQFLSHQSQDEGVNGLCNSLRQLRVALRAAAQQAKNAEYVIVLLVCADLLDERGTSKWTEIPRILSDDPASSFPGGTATSAAEGKSLTLGAAEVVTISRSPTDHTDPLSASMPHASHRRIRSTGGVLDQESRPELGRQRLPATQVWRSSPQSNAVDPLSRSYSHARQISGYM